ncbi:hypothetical protein K7640_09535 [Micromonospora sp. PLK6-60]|uniref:hypothetical protein n=1 Tax=Micromonospora sp. PLK6-60 TaxID=2873383 RepID=UPI001CA75F75|nr:hypothetical protein [Micromonospora sp. PLK6-60]MBY8872080.1 hypothetical protein [Micromonospora sp. PLK6-60]
MNVRRFSATAFAAALLIPSVAACNGAGGTEAGASASPAASGDVSPGASGAVDGDAKQALLDSTNAIREGNFKFTMSAVGSTAEGQVHEPSQSAQIKLTIGQQSSDLMMTLDMIHIKPDSWVKADLGGSSAGSVPGLQKLNLGKYQHLDQTRIKGNRNLGFDFEKLDPGGSAVLTQGITEARQTGEGSYEGTLDVSKAAEAGSVDPTLITTLGAQAQSVPFTAKLDSEGRLSELVLQLPTVGQSAAPAQSATAVPVPSATAAPGASASAAPGGASTAGAGATQEIKVTYSDYGNASAAQKPPADQVVEAPPEFYNLFR